MTRLSVNINKVALLRNSRGGNIPDLYKFAEDCEAFGAQGITVHPRPDERHIRYSDVPVLKKIVRTEFNIEGYPSKKFMDMVLDIRPDQCTLVPDPPGVLTSSEGWDTLTHKDFLIEIISALKDQGIRTSLFLNPDARQVEGAAHVGTDRIELYTGGYAQVYPSAPQQAVEPHRKAARLAGQMGLGVNAGHDLNLENLKYYRDHIPNLLEVSIGHAIIRDALYFGISNVIMMYKRLLQ